MKPNKTKISTSTFEHCIAEVLDKNSKINKTKIKPILEKQINETQIKTKIKTKR